MEIFWHYKMNIFDPINTIINKNQLKYPITYYLKHTYDMELYIMGRRKPKFSIQDFHFKVIRKIWEIYTQDSHIQLFKTNQILTFTSSYIQETNRNIKQNPPIKRSECHKFNLRNETVLDLPLHRLQKPKKSYNIRGLRFSTRSQKILIDIIANSNIFLKVSYLALAYRGLFVKFMLQNILIGQELQYTIVPRF